MILKHGGEYATFKQWSDLGGKIRKGEKSEVVTFWKIQPYEEENENGEKVIKQIPLLRYYNVFHISQVDGVEPKEKLEINEHEPIEEAEKIKTEYINRERLKIFEKATNKAFYTPTFDYIEVPCKEQYQNIEEFYLIHDREFSIGTVVLHLDNGIEIFCNKSNFYSKKHNLHVFSFPPKSTSQTSIVPFEDPSMKISPDKDILLCSGISISPTWTISLVSPAFIF